MTFLAVESTEKNLNAPKKTTVVSLSLVASEVVREDKTLVSVQ